MNSIKQWNGRLQCLFRLMEYDLGLDSSAWKPAFSSLLWQILLLEQSKRTKQAEGKLLTHLLF